TADAIVASQRRNDSSAKGGASIGLMTNGETRQIGVPSDMPVMWVLRDVLGLTGTKFGCGMALCGACTVQLDGQAIRSCVTPVSAGSRRTTAWRSASTPRRSPQLQPQLREICQDATDAK